MLAGRDSCSVMLTGGRSAERLYLAWAGLESFKSLTGVDFYFGDERCVLPTSPDSNYGLAMRTLFREGVPDGCRVHRMQAEVRDREAACVAYETTLPDRVDVLLLGVGGDGHIASLFPGEKALDDSGRRVVPATAPKSPRPRLTVTPSVVAQARFSFVLAPGEQKARLFERIFLSPADHADLPAKLAARAVWLMDTPLKPYSEHV